MKYLKLIGFFLVIVVVFSGCGESKEEKAEREERAKREEEKAKREEDIKLLYKYAGFYVVEIIRENCGSENQPKCNGVCVNTDSLKNEKMRDACYIRCDFDPSSTFGEALGRIMGEAIFQALTIGLVPDFCHKPELAESK